MNKLRNELDTPITKHTTPTWKIPVIDENSGIGQQIKYYRRILNVKQTDLCAKLGCKRGVLNQLENREIKLINIDIIQGILKELNIEDKINMNDDYIAFILNNPSETIVNFRNNNNLKISDLSKMIKTNVNVIKKWEKGTEQITRNSYNKLKSCMELYS